jgi:hypothetical protein
VRQFAIGRGDRAERFPLALDSAALIASTVALIAIAVRLYPRLPQ